MKTAPIEFKPRRPPSPPVTRPKTALGRLVKAHPEVEPALEWLRDTGCDAGGMVAASLSKLAGRGRHLPRPQRARYALKVVANEFFRRWSARHRGRRTVRGMQNDVELNDRELRPFLLMLVAAVGVRSFDRVLPRMARRSVAARGGVELGNAHDFECFVATHGQLLAHRFLSNFDPSRPGGSRNAVGYLETTAVSHYLHRRTEDLDRGRNLAGYLRESRRLRRRTVIATKLAYLPALLTPGERRLLRERYGVGGSLTGRMKIKEVAGLLGYPSGGALSRKLYRVRKWADAANAAGGEGGDV